MSLVPPGNPSAEDELRAIIARAQTGDVAAFNILIERFQHSAYTVALRMLGDADMAADVTQDALLAAFKGMARFRGGSFRVWLLRIVTNQCRDTWRARKRRPQVSLDTLTTPTAEDTGSGTSIEILDDAWDPALIAERHELRDLIQQGLLTLPDDQRAAIVLSDIEGLSYDEIAAVTQVNLGTVKSRIARARARLRNYLNQHRELLPRVYRHSSQAEPSPPQTAPTGTTPDREQL